MNDTGVNQREWIGREQRVADVITAAPLVGLSATLDRQDPVPQDGDLIPPFWHWLYFLPRTRSSELGADGHARLGGFLPPIEFPHRMWAGSRVAFEQALHVGDQVERVSRIADITEKTGRSGRMVFVTVEHTIHSPLGIAVREAQDLVYREHSTASVAVPPSTTVALAPDFSRVITPDPVLLFRYSALTFNSHRIHYDRRHAMDIEGYPGLLVHGPLIATLLLELLRDTVAGATVRSFAFRAERPLFDTASFSIHGRLHEGNHLRALGARPEWSARRPCTRDTRVMSQHLRRLPGYSRRGSRVLRHRSRRLSSAGRRRTRVSTSVR
ncbi:MAG: MaoC family dehydratase N-terminal domain-containing protein [Gemmatimonadaceae bacterium]